MTQTDATLIKKSSITETSVPSKLNFTVTDLGIFAQISEEKPQTLTAISLKSSSIKKLDFVDAAITDDLQLYSHEGKVLAAKGKELVQISLI